MVETLLCVLVVLAGSIGGTFLLMRVAGPRVGRQDELGHRRGRR
jgi:hypothetical protein